MLNYSAMRHRSFSYPRSETIFMTKTKRSGHKKSTNGCANCKRKHIKCDETRPSCVNCITQRRRCPYENYRGAPAAMTPTTSSSIESFAASSPILPQSSSPAVQLNLPTPWFDLIYVELLQQWLTETHRSYVFNDEHAKIYGPTTFNHALAFPFLMHGILANAALHLGLKRPFKEPVYRQHADDLLTQALSEFNALSPNFSSESIVAAFLFSNITSAHKMTTCFLSAASDVDRFLDHFVECLRISRGVNIVLQGWWEYLQSTELKPILMVSDQLRAEEDIERHTSEFDSVRHLICSFESTNSCGTTNIYLDSIQKLQWANNVQCALNSPELNRSISWVFAWPMNVSLELIDLLEMRRPEAIVILAHYAPLLHCRRSCWAIGNAGAYMFQVIESSLGPKWAPWLRSSKKAFGTT